MTERIYYLPQEEKSKEHETYAAIAARAEGLMIEKNKKNLGKLKDSAIY